jgi:hypothetical protein
MTLTEFVRKLELSGTPYEIIDYGDATYVELEDGHLGFRFNKRFDLSGGWLRPPSHYDFGSSPRRIAVRRTFLLPSEY